MSHTDTKPGPQTDAKTDAKTGTEAVKNGKPGRKAGSTIVRPDTSAFDLNAIAGAVAAPAEVITLSQPTVERKPEQLAMDKVVERAHAAWVKAGRPSAWAKMPVVTYYLDPTHVEGYKYLIRRAADFHGIRPRFGTPTRVTRSLIGKLAAAGTVLPVEYEGREILAWAAMDKRPRVTSDAKPETKPEAKPDAKPDAK
jgi:hypothetical protein